MRARVAVAVAVGRADRRFRRKATATGTTATGTHAAATKRVSWSRKIALTAADELAAHTGRAAVETQVRLTSAHAALDVPFLRTRELFTLEYADYPHYADAYLAKTAPARLAYLDKVIDPSASSMPRARPALICGHLAFDFRTPRC